MCSHRLPKNGDFLDLSVLLFTMQLAKIIFFYCLHIVANSCQHYHICISPIHPLCSFSYHCPPVANPEYGNILCAFPPSSFLPSGPSFYLTNEVTFYKWGNFLKLWPCPCFPCLSPFIDFLVASRYGLDNTVIDKPWRGNRITLNTFSTCCKEIKFYSWHLYAEWFLRE